MTTRILKSKVLVVAVLLLACTVSCSVNAFAWGGHGGGGHGHYSYHGGQWHNSGWFWGSFAAGLTIGAIVATLPPYYETVYVRGSPYYYYDGIYYRPYPTGYVVVPAPATTTVVRVPAATTVLTVPAVTQPQVISGETVVINIPNASGGYTPVTVTKYKTGYIGPQGEYYEGHPTVEQLRALYGR
jgi:hypothetical protein